MLNLQVIEKKRNFKFFEKIKLSEFMEYEIKELVDYQKEIIYEIDKIVNKINKTSM